MTFWPQCIHIVNNVLVYALVAMRPHIASSYFTSLTRE